MTESSCITIDYNNLFKNAHHKKFDLEKYKKKVDTIRDAEAQTNKYILIPTNINAHATVVLFNQDNGKKYLFDSSMVHYNNLKVTDKSSFLNYGDLKLICNFNKECF